MEIENKDIKLHHIKWYTISRYVDTDTGEELSRRNAQQNYTIIKTTKHANVNKNVGTIEYTRECKRTNQTKLQFD